jgi:acyl-coenzyme A thioesterase PaaI-like protein
MIRNLYRQCFNKFTNDKIVLRGIRRGMSIASTKWLVSGGVTVVGAVYLFKSSDTLWGKDDIHMFLAKDEREENKIYQNLDAVKLIQELESDPEFERFHYDKVDPNAATRNFLRSKKQGTQDVKKFEYITYFSKKQQKTVSIFYCGPHLEGPPGCTHGGAMATILDSVMGTNVWRCNLFALTANLNINYRKFLPLNSVVVCEAKVTKIDGRKVWANGVLRSIDGKTVHADATGLWIVINPEKYLNVDPATVKRVKTQ